MTSNVAYTTYQLDRARRTAARLIASTIVAGMAETDIDFKTAAQRISWDEGKLRSALSELIEGRDYHKIKEIADIAYAFGFILKPHLSPVAQWPGELGPGGTVKEAA